MTLGEFVGWEGIFKDLYPVASAPTGVGLGTQVQRSMVARRLILRSIQQAQASGRPMNPIFYRDLARLTGIWAQLQTARPGAQDSIAAALGHFKGVNKAVFQRVIDAEKELTTGYSREAQVFSEQTAQFLGPGGGGVREAVRFWEKRLVTEGPLIQPSRPTTSPKVAPPPPPTPHQSALKPTLSRVSAWLKNNKGKVAAGAAIAGAAYGAYSLITGGDSTAYVAAGMLGQRGNILLDYLQKGSDLEEMTPRQQARVQTGEAVHKIIQQRMLQAGEAVGSELHVKSKALGVQGYIDVMMPGGIPMEIKTIEGENISSITRPKAAHMSQLNFYMHSVGAPYGVLRYAMQDDPEVFIDFKLPYEPGRLIADLDNLASEVMQLQGKVRPEIIRWARQRSTDRGIRNEHGFNSSFHAMKSGGDFARGRISSVSQLRKSLEAGRIRRELPPPPDPFANFYHGNRSKQRS